MDLAQIRNWLIKEIKEIDDKDLLLYFKKSIEMSQKEKIASYYTLDDDDHLEILHEPGIAEGDLQKTEAKHQLNSEQQERLIKELEEAEDDIRHGRFISNEEMKTYMNSLFNMNNTDEGSLD